MLQKKDKLWKAKLALLDMLRHSWEQGVAMQAFYELGEEDVVIAMAKEAAYRSTEDGRVACIGTMNAVTDPCATGEALLFATKHTKEKDLFRAYNKLLQWALVEAPRSEEGIVYHVMEEPQFWVDSMYMLPPFLAAAGHFEEALQQIRGYWNALYCPKKKLMSHIYDEKEKQFVRKDFWGVGNGWAMVGLARVIDLLPYAQREEKAELIHLAKILIDSVSNYIREDGLAHDILDDKESFVEVNLPQMLSYTIYKGVKSGWLGNEYLEIANRCREAVNNNIDQYGLVQNVCGAPEFNLPGVAPEGQAFYLLMEAAAAKL